MTELQHQAEEHAEHPPVQPEEPPRSPVPWEDRQRIGNFRAFWSTVFMVVASGGRLGRLIDEPLSVHEAKRFSRRCVWHSLGGLVVLVLLAAIPMLQEPSGPLSVESFTDIDGGVVVALVSGIVLTVTMAWLFGANGMIKWFFRPKSLAEPRQGTAVALAHYLAAPAALMALFLPLVLLLVTSHRGLSGAVGAIQRASGWIGLLILLYWLQVVTQAARSVAGRTLVGVLATGAGLLVLWVILGAALTLIPAAVVMWLSMHASMSW